MKWWWTAKELAGMPGMPGSKRGINKKALKEAWPHKPREGQGGGREFPLEALPVKTQQAIIEQATAEEIKEFPRTKILKLAPSVRNLVALKLNGLDDAMRGRLLKRDDTKAPISPHDMKIASLKAELVEAYTEAVEEEVRSGKKRIEAKKDFAKAYNTDRLLPHIYNVVGKRSWKTLDRWARLLREAGGDCSVLVPGYRLRKRRPERVTELEASVLLKLLLKQERIKIGTAIHYAKWIIEREGAESPSSPSTLRRFVENFKRTHADIWTLARHGEKALKDKVLPFLERDTSLFKVGDCLVADGHKMNFKVINPFTGRPCRPTLVLWMDWASRDVCGYTIMPTEDIYAIHDSLRRAILKLGKIPKYVLLDNGKAFKARVFTEEGFRGLYGRLGIQTYFARPYEARTKPVERFFGTLGTQFERLMTSYTGASIADKPARMMRNEKFMQTLSPEKIPTIEEVSRRLDAWIEYYRRRPHGGLKGKSPMEVFEAGKGPGVPEDRLRFLMMFQEKKRIGRNGIRFLHHYYWHEKLFGLRDRVNIRYDLSDLTRILVYDRNWAFICTAKRTEKVDPLYRLHGGKEAASYPEFKHRLKEQRRLLTDTKKLVRLAAKRGQADEIDKQIPWMQAMESDPKIIEKCEKIRAEAEPDDILRVDPEPVDVETYQPMPARGSVNPAIVTEVPSDEEFEEMKRELEEWAAQRRAARNLLDENFENF